MVNRLEEFLTRANHFVSPHTGLVKKVFEVCTEPDDARLHFIGTEMAVTSRYGDLFVNCSNNNGGAGLSREEAIAAAIGESIERYACSVCSEELFLSTYNDLQGRAVHPQNLTPYSAAQYAQKNFPYQPFTAITPIRWIQGISLLDNKPIWYPASLTHVPYSFSAGEIPIAPSVTTGMALAMTPSEAILSGLCEVVERDSFMIMWWNRLPVPEIIVPENSWLGQIIKTHFSIPGVRFRLFNITTDTGIPSVVCIVEDARDNGCAIACGAATRPDPAEAVLKALIEAAQTRSWVRHLSRQNGRLETDNKYSNINSFENHVRLYAHHTMRQVLKFILDNGHTINLFDLPNMSTSNVSNTLRRCVNGLMTLGLEPIAIDLTPIDVAEAGLSTIKVAIPGMVELNSSHNLRCFGYKRLYDAPIHMGYYIKEILETELNPFPHPFP